MPRRLTTPITLVRGLSRLLEPLRSVLTSVGRGPCFRARVKNRQVAARSRFSDTSTSMTWTNWSIARYR